MNSCKKEVEDAITKLNFLNRRGIKTFLCFSKSPMRFKVVPILLKGLYAEFKGRIKHRYWKFN